MNFPTPFADYQLFPWTDPDTGVKWIRNEEKQRWAHYLEPAVSTAPQKLSGHGAVAAVSLATAATTIANTGTAHTTTTLAAGSDGQTKTLCFVADGGFDAVVTVANAAWGGSGLITMDAADDLVILQYLADHWRVLANIGCVLT
jgi:hypothetical protein